MDSPDELSSSSFSTDLQEVFGDKLSLLQLRQATGRERSHEIWNLGKDLSQWSKTKWILDIALHGIYSFITFFDENNLE